MKRMRIQSIENLATHKDATYGEEFLKTAVFFAFAVMVLVIGAQPALATTLCRPMHSHCDGTFL